MSKIELIMPKMGESVAEATIIKWLKNVGDAIEANILAAKHPHSLDGEVFNIGSGNNYSINDVADMFGGEKKYGKKVTEPFETFAQTLKARRILGWEPKGDLPSWIKKYKEDLKL